MDGGRGVRPAPRAPWRRPRDAWAVLDRGQRLAVGASLALLVSMALPWYSTSFVDRQVVDGRLQSDLVSGTKSALFVFSWVEASVLLICLAVLAMLFARGERRPFHLPGGDGVVLALAGAWASLLIAWRFFDKPGLGDVGAVGVAWGIFVALGCAIALTTAGLRVRAAGWPEPPLRRSREPRLADAEVTDVHRPG